jgi:hypothetical protein
MVDREIRVNTRCVPIVTIPATIQSPIPLPTTPQYTTNILEMSDILRNIRTLFNSLSGETVTCIYNNFMSYPIRYKGNGSWVYEVNESISVDINGLNDDIKEYFTDMDGWDVVDIWNENIAPHSTHQEISYYGGNRWCYIPQSIERALDLFEIIANIRRLFTIKSMTETATIYNLFMPIEIEHTNGDSWIYKNVGTESANLYINDLIQNIRESFIHDISGFDIGIIWNRYIVPNSSYRKIFYDAPVWRYINTGTENQNTEHTEATESIGYSQLIAELKEYIDNYYSNDIEDIWNAIMPHKIEWVSQHSWRKLQ